MAKKISIIIFGSFFIYLNSCHAEPLTRINSKNEEKKFISALQKGSSRQIRFKKMSQEAIICCAQPVTFDKELGFENINLNREIIFDGCVFEKQIDFTRFQANRLAFNGCHFIVKNLKSTDGPVAIGFSYSSFDDLRFSSNIFEITGNNLPRWFSIILDNVTVNYLYNSFLPARLFAPSSNSGPYAFFLQSSKINNVFLTGKLSYLDLFDLESQKLTLDGLSLENLIISNSHAHRFEVGEVDWPTKCVVDGFTYESILDCETNYPEWSVFRDQETTPQHPFLIALDRSHCTSQGYSQYEKAVRDGGDLMKADNVFYHFQKRLWSDAFITTWPLVSPVYRFLKFMLFWLTGYFKTTFCLIPLTWTFLTIGLGCFVFRGKNMVERAKLHLGYSAFWYTVDLFLPGINLHAEENWYPRNRWQLFYLRFVKLFGRFLFGVLVGVWIGVFK